LKKIFIQAAFLAIYSILEVITWICFALDEIFFSEYKKIRVKAPVFIVGMPRTASTLLHKTLYSDSEHFTSMKSWEVMLAPSIIQKKAVNLLRKLDRRCGCFLSSFIKKIDRYLFRDYEIVHPTSFFEIEEDDILMMHLFSSNLMVFIFPGIRHLRNLAWFDERISEKRKRRIMRFFSRCIEKHLYVYGNGRTYLSKCPSHTAKIRSLKSCFPDSRFICTFRDPVSVIPSMLSMFGAFLKIYGHKADLSRMTGHALQIADHWYAYPLENFSGWTSADYVLVDYDELSGSPASTVTGICEHFGFNVTDAFSQKLAAVGLKCKTYKSSHHYAGADFNLEDEEIRHRYGPVYQKYLISRSSSESHTHKADDK